MLHLIQAGSKKQKNNVIINKINNNNKKQFKPGVAILKSKEAGVAILKSKEATVLRKNWQNWNQNSHRGDCQRNWHPIF